MLSFVPAWKIVGAVVVRTIALVVGARMTVPHHARQCPTSPCIESSGWQPIADETGESQDLQQLLRGDSRSTVPNKKAAHELDRYRRKGAGPTTRFLIDGLLQAGIVGGSLLGVGVGIGALTFELLDRGIRRATIVEASAGYAATASEEAARRGRTTDIKLERGDFVALSDTLPAASVVTLDRVVCCYPLYERLLSEAVRHAQRGFAFSYPRDRWYTGRA